MLRWLQSSGNGQTARTAQEEPVDEQSCPGMARALERILSKEEQPEVLDLGQHSRSAAVYLANRGARVCVDAFVPPPETPKKKKGQDDSDVEKTPVVLAHEDKKFDLVLAWEHWDFIPPDRLADFAAEVDRVLAPGGLLVMYCRDAGQASDVLQEQPASYRLTADDKVIREQDTGPTRPRWGHQNRKIEQALAPLSVQSIHLQRNRIREFLVRKPDKKRKP